MMKKTIAALIAAGLAGVSGFGYAADDAVTKIESGVYVENDATGCSLLRDRVTVNTSVGTTLVYNCLTADSKINVGGCHASGSTKPTQVKCVTVGTDTTVTPNVPLWNGPGCASEDDDTEIAGRRAFVGSSSGGSIGVASLNATVCDEDSLGGLSGVTD